ncbi:MAG: aldo/keto reductase [Gemmatimonadota bacterium]
MPAGEPSPRSGGSSDRREFLLKLAGVGAGLGAGALLSRPAAALARESAGPGGTLRALQETLPTREVPVSGEPIPVVGFGSTKSVLESPTEGTEPIENVIQMLLEYGGRVVDTSPRTPEIDEEFGRILQQPGIRDEIFLAAKVFVRGEEEGLEQMTQNRRLLAGGRPLDLLQVESVLDLETHWPNVLEWKEAGYTRYAGATVFRQVNHDRLERFMRNESPDFVHMNYSIMEPEAEEVLLPLARDRGMAVLINRPFMNGEWFGLVEGRELPEWTREFGCETWAQFSLKYILANPAVTCVLTETTNPEHMEENIRAGLGRHPTEAERRRMREVVESF